MPNHHQEDFNSHELSSTRYQSFQDPNHANHNAFGDDSDSDDHRDKPPPDQPPAFDVYKDFNNSGVRYATLLNSTNEQTASDPSYKDIDPAKDPDHRSNLPQSSFSHHPKSEESDEDPFNDLISRSPSNPKFQNDSKSGKNRDHRTPSNRWKTGSIIAFLSLACFATLIFFMAPRQPFISFEVPIKINSGPRPEGTTDTSVVFSPKDPTEFSFDARISMALDGRSSYIPTLIRKFRVVISDLGSLSESVLVGKGQLNKGFTASTSKLTYLDFNVTFHYNAKSSSDTLWQNWRKACGNIEQSKVNGTVTRPALQLYVVASFDVIGMIGTRSDSTQLTNVACPVELPANAPSF